MQMRAVSGSSTVPAPSTSLAPELVGHFLEGPDRAGHRHGDFGGADASLVKSAHCLNRGFRTGAPHHRNNASLRDECENLFGRHQLYAITGQPGITADVYISGVTNQLRLTSKP